MTLVAMVALVCGAVGVRVWLMISYSPAFLGYPDSSQYVLAATHNLFYQTQRTAGYPLFLRLIHYLSNRIVVTIAVQHALGILTGLLLYKSVRRTGAPPWLGLLPAAVAFFEGTGLTLEHALLTDSLLAFLQAVVIYLAIRALYQPSMRWWLLVGVAVGVSFWFKTVAIASAVLIPLILLVGTPGAIRRRFLGVGTVLVTTVAAIAIYVGVQYYSTGYFGYERQSAWNLYGRVATFVNCSTLTPPAGTAFLCPSEPVSARKTPAYYQVSPSAPAVQRFGYPWRAPAYANGVIDKFSVAAIEQQPVAYAEAIMHGLGRYLFPRHGEGTTPGETREYVIAPQAARELQADFAPFYPHDHGYLGSPTAVHPLAVYESYTRIEGPILIILLLAAIAGPFFLPARLRWTAALFTLTALSTILLAVAGSGYDARYAYPTFGPLAAGAALGAWGIGYRLRRRRAPAISRRVPAVGETAEIHSQ
jgi:hypothetical protein